MHLVDVLWDLLLQWPDTLPNFTPLHTPGVGALPPSDTRVSVSPRTPPCVCVPPLHTRVKFVRAQWL
jgi:hypothetical protein